MTTTAQIEESTPRGAASGSPALSGATMLAVSCAVLILEVSLTRVFSFVMWYHLTYLVISLALLGYGAGLGSFIAVVAINRLGAVCAIFLAATLPALAALAASWKDRLADKITSGLLVVLLAGCSALSVSHDLLRLKISRGKDLTSRQDQIIYTAWNIVGRVDVTTPIFERAHFGGRISDAYLGPLPWVLPIFQDATAPTALVHVDGRAADYPLLDYYLQGAPYTVRPRPRSVLIIGIGGGIDALIAEHAGARW